MLVFYVICNIVLLNVFCGYGCNCFEKIVNNCFNKMEYIRILVGCLIVSLFVWFYIFGNNVIL